MRNNGSRPYKYEKMRIMEDCAENIQMAERWMDCRVDVGLQLELTNTIQAQQRLIRAIKEKEKEWKQ